MTLHPAQNRGFRELVASSRHVIEHFESLAPRFGDDTDGSPIAETLNDGGALARDLLREIRAAIAEHDLYGGPAAQSVGKSFAGARGGVGDRFLERNQALRMAVLDVQHTVTLLAYLESVCGTTGTIELAELCHYWHGEMHRLELRMRAAVIVLGKEPDVAIEPVDSGVLGRAAHSVGYWVGTFGEWFDRRDAEKQGHDQPDGTA